METRPMVWEQLWPPPSWGSRHCGVSVNSCAFSVAWWAAEEAGTYIRYVKDDTSFGNLSAAYRDEREPATGWRKFLVNAIWKLCKATQHHDVKILPGGLKLILYTWTQRSGFLQVTSGMWHSSNWKSWFHRIQKVNFRGQTNSEMSSISVARER